MPTGATPQPFYSAFVANANIDRASVFLLDEFVLPEDDPARCDSTFSQDLIDRLAAPPARVTTWDTSGDLEAECLKMEARISDGGLRLAIVGLGMNGHIGTNEPGSPIDSRCRVVELDTSTSQGALAYGARTAPTEALTMGIATLLEADEIWLLVTGSHKKDILHEVTAGPITPLVPASLLRNHERFVVIANEDAAQLIS